MKVKNDSRQVFSMRGPDRKLFEVRRGESAEVPADLAEHDRIKGALRSGRLTEDKGGGEGRSSRAQRSRSEPQS